MSRALLGVNVLLALLDSDHVDHDRAHAWFERDAGDGWASCAVTENGFVRIVSQPRYPSPISPAEAVSLLRDAIGGTDHDFGTCDISVLDAARVDSSRVHGSRQVTDAYLLALAVAHDGRFVTFDRSVVIGAVPRAAPDHLLVL